MIGAVELLGQLHRAQRLAIALGPRVAEVAVDLLLGVAALLVADDQHRVLVVARQAGDDGVVVGEAAIAVDLDEVGEQPLDVVERRRPRRMPRHQHALPRRQRARRARCADRRDARLAAGRCRAAARSVAGSIDSASISFSRTPIGSSNSSRSGMTVAYRSVNRAGAAQLLDGGEQLLGRADANLRGDVGAHAQPARRRARPPARARPAGRPGAARAGPTAPRASPACSRRSGGCAPPWRAARAALSSGDSSVAWMRDESSSRSNLPRTSTSVPFSIRWREAARRSRGRPRPRRRPGDPRA